MLWILIAVAALLIVLVITTQQKNRAAEGDAPAVGTGLPYRKANYLLKADERQFFDVLRQVAGNQFLVFPKVGLVHLLQIEAKSNERNAARNRISQRTVDFVLVTPDTLTPILVIELDEPSQQAQESKVKAICMAAGMPYLPVPSGREWNAAQLSAFIGQALSETTAAPTQRRR